MFNLRGRITSKLLELPFIWLYGSKRRAELEAVKFRNDKEYNSDDEFFKAFANVDFWKYLFGLDEKQPFHLSKLLSRIERIDHDILLKKITNPYQLELLRNKQHEKNSIGIKIFSVLWSKKAVNKQTICDEFEVSNETLVKWLEFIESHQWIQKINADVSEDFQPFVNSVTGLKKSYKLSLLDYMLLHQTLNKDNPVSVLSFTKEDLSYLINQGPTNLYKNLCYVINGEELTFEIFPFTIFTQLAKNNGYDNEGETLKADLEEILQKKLINSAVPADTSKAT